MVARVLQFVRRRAVLKLKVLEVREEPDKIQDLSVSAVWVFKGEESKTWRQVAEAPQNDWHKARYLKIVYPKFLEVRERGEVT